MKLDGFGIMVNDMVKMVNFYRDALGFEIKQKEKTSNVYLEKDGTLFMLHSRADFEKMTGQKFSYVSGLNGHFQVSLSVSSHAEVDKAFEAATKAGGKAVVNPITEPWGMRICYLSDPEGNMVEIGCMEKK